MKLTVANTSSSFEDLMDPADIALINQQIPQQGAKWLTVVFQNLSTSQSVFVEKYKAATTTESVEITPGNFVTITTNTLFNDVNLIGEDNNIDVRYIVNW